MFPETVIVVSVCVSVCVNVSIPVTERRGDDSEGSITARKAGQREVSGYKSERVHRVRQC